MHDLKIAADLGIVVPETVNAVGAVSDDSPRAILIKRFNISFGKLLKQQLIAHAASGFPRAAFFGTEYGEIHLGCGQQSNHATGDFLQSTIVSRGTADPVEQL